MGNDSRQQRVGQLEQACRQRGLPVTVQRRAVFEAILDHEDHPAADQIYEQIKSKVPGIARTTVYRILDTFVELGLIVRICHPSSNARFDSKTHRHHHLVCSYCEAIIDLDDQPSISVEIPDVDVHGFEIDDYHVHFRGICAACRRGKQKGGRTPRKKEVRKTTRRSVAKKSGSGKKGSNKR